MTRTGALMVSVPGERLSKHFKKNIILQVQHQDEPPLVDHRFGKFQENGNSLKTKALSRIFRKDSKSMDLPPAEATSPEREDGVASPEATLVKMHSVPIPRAVLTPPCETTRISPPANRLPTPPDSDPGGRHRLPLNIPQRRPSTVEPLRQEKKAAPQAPPTPPLSSTVTKPRNLPPESDHPPVPAAPYYPPMGYDQTPPPTPCFPPLVPGRSSVIFNLKTGFAQPYELAFQGFQPGAVPVDLTRKEDHRNSLKAPKPQRRRGRPPRKRPPEEALPPPASEPAAAPYPSAHQEMFHLSQLTNADTLNPEEYSNEIQRLEATCPPPFIHFYKYVTSQQIRNGQQPISFKMFLYFHNNNRLRELEKQFDAFMHFKQINLNYFQNFY